MSTANAQVTGQWADQQRIWQQKERQKVAQQQKQQDEHRVEASRRTVFNDQRPRSLLATTAVDALLSGTIASVISAAALATFARAEGQSAIQPINATSHWIHGEEAGQQSEPDVRHTLPGALTHHAACVFWAFLFEATRSEKESAAETTGKAAAVAAVAAAVDYGLVPKRLSPGWEEVLPPRSILGGFAAMAVGLAVGGMLTSSRGRRSFDESRTARGNKIYG